jgi:hypothetical protein
MSPGLVALGPGMFSVNGVVVMRLMLGERLARVTARNQEDLRQLEFSNRESRRDNGGGTTHVTPHQFHVLTRLN